MRTEPLLGSAPRVTGKRPADLAGTGGGIRVSMGRRRRPGTMEDYALPKTENAIFGVPPYPSYLGGAVFLRVPTLKNLQY
jgi:hypothetical protein